MAAIGCDNGRLLLWEVASGKMRGAFRHQDGVRSVQFSPDSRLLAAASSDAPIYLWDVYGTRAGPAEVDAVAAGALWDELLPEDAGKAFTAMKKLINAPRAATELLATRLKTLPPDKAKLKRLIDDLDATDFEARKQATAALLKLDEQADAFLRAARSRSDSPEVQQRLDEVLHRPLAVAPERLRALRGVEVLEAIGTPQAAAALKALVAAPADDRLTIAARNAMKRIRQRGK
jgi:hypothetical protein